MPVTIRLAREDDSRAIAALCAGPMGHPEATEERVAAQLPLSLRDGAQRVWVAEVDGKVAGFAHAADYDLLYTPPIKNLLSLAVFDEYQGQGAGGALVAAFEAWAFADGAAARILSSEWRSRSHAIYRKLGYEAESRKIRFMKKPPQTKQPKDTPET